ncbi:MAG: class E sortase [Acidobacteriota bacterium]|nr:class E sortase [Acidobacteriota bacterium]
MAKRPRQPERGAAGVLRAGAHRPHSAAIAAAGRGGGRAPFRGTERRTRGGVASRAARAVSWLLIVLGVLALADAGVTMVWQEPLSALYATFQQEQLEGALAQLDAAAPSQIVAQRLAFLHREDARIAFLARNLEHSAPEGSAVGRIQIPRIGISFAVVNGTGTSDLEKGPGIYSRTVYPQSRFPGLGGVTAIAGHRTTFLAPFRQINELRAGNRIILTMPYASIAYTVQRTRIVRPEDVRAALEPGGGTRLVLSACDPPFSAAYRMLIYASQASVTPLGAARSYVQGIIAHTYPSSRLGRAVGLPDGGLVTKL